MNLLADNGAEAKARSSQPGALSAKQLVSQYRRQREGFRAFASKETEPAQAASVLDERLVRLLHAINTCEIDASLSDQCVAPPNTTCRNVASKVAQDLYLAHRMRPIRVAASLEGGIMLVYRDHPQLEMEIEADNEGDVTGVLSTDDEVLMSAMITLPAELSRLVTTYRLSTPSAMQRSQ